MRRTGALAIAAFMAAALVAGCGSGGNASGSASGSGSGSGSAPAEGDQTPAFGESDATTVVNVKATEYTFELDKATAAGKKVFFKVANTGAEDHEFEILGADGKTVDEIAAFKAGETKTLAVELSPGTYTAQCLVKDKNGKEHVELGMKTTFTVT